MSIRENNVYKAIHINNGIDKTLYSSADLKSNFKIDIKPLVIPHPKQENPKIVFTGHSDTDKTFDKI